MSQQLELHMPWLGAPDKNVHRLSISTKMGGKGGRKNHVETAIVAGRPLVRDELSILKALGLMR